MSQLKLFLFIALILCGFDALAQTVTMKSNKEDVDLQSEFVITIEVDKAIDSMSTFNPVGFAVRGPAQKVNNSFSKGKSLYRRTYSYFLRPKNVGTFTIDSPRFFFDGKSFAANPVTITVGYGGPVESPINPDSVVNNTDYIDNPDGSVRFVVAGDIGYVEERRFGKWVVLRELTAKEMEQLKKK